jgi:hypothetical protein
MKQKEQGNEGKDSWKESSKHKQWGRFCYTAWKLAPKTNQKDNFKNILGNDGTICKSHFTAISLNVSAIFVLNFLSYFIACLAGS